VNTATDVQQQQMTCPSRKKCHKTSAEAESFASHLRPTVVSLQPAQAEARATPSKRTKPCDVFARNGATRLAPEPS
jgi:hypothetical protein